MWESQSVVWLRADLQDAAGDVWGDLGVRRVLVFALRLQVVLQTRLPKGHEQWAVTLHRTRLPYRRGDASDADLHHRLVVVISHVILHADSSNGFNTDV